MSPAASRGDGVQPEGSGLLGVVLCGGQSRRFGSHKALATLDGVPFWRRAVEALSAAGLPAVAVVNDPVLAAGLDVPTRPDLRPGLGPLGGIATGLAWARESGAPGAFILACDLPLVSGELLRAIAGRWPGRGVAVLQSDSRWGLEPLCGAWGVDCLPVVSAALDRGERAVGSVLQDLDVVVLPPADLAVGDAGREITGVNRPEDLQRLEDGRSGGGS